VISVRHWCQSTSVAISEYWGPQIQILRSLAEKVNFPEFKFETFDLNDFKNVFAFLEFVQKQWEARYATKSVEIVPRKTESETWLEFLIRLGTWTHTRSLNPSDE